MKIHTLQNTKSNLKEKKKAKETHKINTVNIIYAHNNFNKI